MGTFLYKFAMELSLEASRIRLMVLGAFGQPVCLLDFVKFVLASQEFDLERLLNFRVGLIILLVLILVQL